MTVKDIWDEKPIPFYTAPLNGEGVYHTEKMDAWLEKLKKYYEMKDHMDEKIMLDVDKKLEAVKTILVNHSEDDPYVAEAYTLQEIADELGVDKGFSIEKLRKILEAEG